MKSARLILACFVVLVLVAWAGQALATNYVNLIQNTEKWFVVDGTAKCPLKLHTVVSGNHQGACILHRETLRGEVVTSSESLLFDCNLEGDVFYHGDLQKVVFAEPVLWVDAPLTVGKTWTDSQPEIVGNKSTGQMVHYVFAVLDQKPVTCTAGTFDCYRVYLAVVQPDGQTKSSTFWYNSECGMVMCALETTRLYKLSKTFVGNGDADPGYDLQDAGQMIDVEGLTSTPNPSNPLANIAFELKNAAQVEVGIYDISGRLVNQLIGGEYRAAGPVSVLWRGTDSGGRNVASGTYIYRVRAGRSVLTDRITLVR